MSYADMLTAMVIDVTDELDALMQARRMIRRSKVLKVRY